MGLRVEEGGASENQPVMGWIGVEPGSNAVRVATGVYHPTRKRANFRLVARHETVWSTTFKRESR
jgi:hypothetical protein